MLVMMFLSVWKVQIDLQMLTEKDSFQIILYYFFGTEKKNLNNMDPFTWFPATN